MNMHKRECELASLLLKGLYRGLVISVDQIEDGIIRLLFRQLSQLTHLLITAPPHSRAPHSKLTF